MFAQAKWGCISYAEETCTGGRFHVSDAVSFQDLLKTVGVDDVLWFSELRLGVVGLQRKRWNATTNSAAAEHQGRGDKKVKAGDRLTRLQSGRVCMGICC